MFRIIFLALLNVVGCASDILCHGAHCVTDALEHPEWEYDHELCNHIMKVTCRTSPSDEPLCGTDGKTYENNCEFAQARCEYVLDQANFGHHSQNDVLGIANLGPCSVTTSKTTSKPTPVPQITSYTGTSQPTTSSSTATSPPIMSTISSQAQTLPDMTSVSKVTTHGQITTTDIMSVSTTVNVPLSTTISIQEIMVGVFCSHKDAIDCTSDFNIVCGSNGQLYPNKCELSKDACNDQSIREADIDSCIV